MKNIEKINNKIKITETSEIDVSEFINQEELKLNEIESRIAHFQLMIDQAQEERRQIKQNIKDYK